MDNEKALKYIKTAVGLAVICSLITLLGIIISVCGDSDFLGLSLYGLVDVVFLLGLAFGVYKKSRVCAVILFIYFILSKIYMLNNYEFNLMAYITAIIFAIGFFQGMRGTIYYHKNKKIEIDEDFHKF